MSSLRFMGVDPNPETFRCRVYGQPEYDADEQERRAFLASLAVDGVLDCPAYDEWIAALQAAGWVPREPNYEPAPGGGRHARWRLTPKGHEMWRAMR